MDIRHTIEDSMSNFEKLVKKIPGYSGYKEKEQRREADALLREHLAQKLEEQWQLTNDIKSQMLVGPAMSQLDEMGRASRKLQTLIDKIKAAAQGYTGFFDAIKVKETALDDLYNFDQEMLDHVADVADAVNAVQLVLDNQENVAPVVRKLDRLISDLITKFETRKDVITQLLLV